LVALALVRTIVVRDTKLATDRIFSTKSNAGHLLFALTGKSTESADSHVPDFGAGKEVAKRALLIRFTTGLTIGVAGRTRWGGFRTVVDDPHVDGTGVGCAHVGARCVTTGIVGRIVARGSTCTSGEVSFVFRAHTGRAK
jgi:hypothetical protein